jgi:hypothetical protein
MTRTEAWRHVAEAFGTPRELRSPEQREITILGLCYALVKVLGIPHDEWSHVYAPMGNLGEYFGCDGTWWPKGADEERATFAALMAAMTQRERDRLEPGL